MPAAINTVREFYEAFKEKDLARIVALAAPGIVVVQSNELPWGGEYHGRDGLQAFLQKLTSSIRSVVSIERIIDAGDTQVALGFTRGTALESGRTFEVAVAHVWQIREGHAISFRPYIDNAAMLTALRG